MLRSNDDEIWANLSSICCVEDYKWGWVARDRRQHDNGHKFWYNTYWKTELAKEETTFQERNTNL